MGLSVLCLHVGEKSFALRQWSINEPQEGQSSRVVDCIVKFSSAVRYIERVSGSTMKFLNQFSPVSVRTLLARRCLQVCLHQLTSQKWLRGGLIEVQCLVHAIDGLGRFVDPPNLQCRIYKTADPLPVDYANDKNLACIQKVIVENRDGLNDATEDFRGSGDLEVEIRLHACMQYPRVLCS